MQIIKSVNFSTEWVLCSVVAIAQKGHSYPRNIVFAAAEQSEC